MLRRGQQPVGVAVGVGIEAHGDIVVVDAEELVDRWARGAAGREVSAQNSTVTPLSLSPVTCVCTEPGKF
jgi:hypothetical protein